MLREAMLVPKVGERNAATVGCRTVVGATVFTPSGAVQTVMADPLGEGEQVERIRALFHELAIEGPTTPAGQALGQQIVAELEALWILVDSTGRLGGRQSV
jgi:hypothetical protein